MGTPWDFERPGAETIRFLRGEALKGPHSGSKAHGRVSVRGLQGRCHFLLCAVDEGKLALAYRSNPTELKVLKHKKLKDYFDKAFPFVERASNRLLLYLRPSDGPGRLLALGEKIEDLGRAPELFSLCYDHHQRRLFGADMEGGGHIYDGESWSMIDADLSSVVDYAYNGPKKQLLTVQYGDGETMMLARWDGSEFKVDEKAPLGRDVNMAGCGVFKDLVFVYGGQDLTEDGSGERILVSKKGGPFEALPMGGKLAMGGYSTLIHTDQALHAINHSGAGLRALDNGQWQTLLPKLRLEDAAKLSMDDSRYSNYALSQSTVYCLNQEGALMAADLAGGKWKRLAKAVGPKAHYSKRTAMAHDAAEDRLIVQGGVGNRETWIFQKKKWRELASTAVPRGIGSLAATPQGAYYLIKSQLWLLKGESWQFVHKDKRGFEGDVILYYQEKNCLLRVRNANPVGEVYVYSGTGWHKLADVPEQVRLSTIGSSEAEAGLDPMTDSLVLVGEKHQCTLGLNALDWPADLQLPTGQTPDPAEAAAGPQLPLIRMALKKSPVGKNEINRVGLEPIGMTKERWPMFKRKPMQHLVTLSRELIAHDLPKQVQAVAVFLSSWTENEAYTPKTKESSLVFLATEDLKLGTTRFQDLFPDKKLQRRYYENADELGSGQVISSYSSYVFDDVKEDEGEDEVEEIVDAEDRAYAVSSFLGDQLNSKTDDLRVGAISAPDALWIQGVETPKGMGVIFQLDENLCPGLNLGDVGILYVAANKKCTRSAAWWQCH